MVVMSILLINTSIDWWRNIACCRASMSGNEGCYAPLGSTSRDRGSKIGRKIATDYGEVGVERSERT